MKRSTAWKSGVPTTGSTCCGSTGAGRIAIGGIGARSFRRTYALSRIRPRCVRGLLSHNDNDPLQETILCGAVLVGGASDSHFCVTRPRTHSILVYNSCYGMSE